MKCSNSHCRVKYFPRGILQNTIFGYEGLSCVTHIQLVLLLFEEAPSLAGRAGLRSVAQHL